MENKHQQDEYRPCSDYANRPVDENGFTIFTSPNGECYFAFLATDGSVILRSQGYSSEVGRDNGIASVLKNRDNEARYRTRQLENGNWVLSLRAGNHLEIAVSCPYDSEEGAKSMLPSERTKAAEAAAKLAAAPPAASSNKEDDYMICREYEEKISETSEKYPGFISFQHENGKYYFAWVEAGKILMRGEGYPATAARDNGIESVIKNRDEEKRFSMLERMGVYFVILKAGNHQEIARSCPLRSEEEARALYPSEREKARAAKFAAAAPPPKAAKAERKDDDYLSCKEYRAHMEEVSEKYPGFITFEQEGEYYFAWVEDGEIVMRSEGYTTESARNNGIESVMKNRDEEKRFSIEEKMGYYFVVLKAGNHQEIARSCPYKDKAAAMAWLPSNRSARGVEVAAAAAALTLTPQTKEEKEDDYLPCSAYEGRKINDKQKNTVFFKHENQYYFAIYDQEGSVRLRSEGFSNAKMRDDELSAAYRNIEKEEQYEIFERGKYRMLILKDADGREVGRGCLERIPVAAAPIITEEKEDDYLKCEEYQGRAINDKQNNVALFKHSNGQYYFAVYDKDGKVRIRSEGFGDAKERDVELSGVLKNIDDEDMYEDIRKGKYRIRVLKDKTGREVGRSCLEKVEEKIIPPIVTAGTAAAAAAVVVPSPSPPPPPKKEVVTAPVPPPVVKKSGGFNWWWLLIPLLLGLLWLLWKGCDGCNKTAPPPPIEKVNPPPAPEPEPEPEPAPPPPPTAPVCACDGSSNNPIFNLPVNKKPKSLSYLGSNPEFGNSHGLDGAGFYAKIKKLAETIPRDRRFLDNLFRAMGYDGGFADADAGMFSETTLQAGTAGNLGSSKRHVTGYYRLDTQEKDLEAFRIEAANGCHMHFMKTCGNHFFFCSK